MKKIVLGLSILMSAFAFAQQRPKGLEGIIVEKYYISDKADSIQADADIDTYNNDNGTTIAHGALPTRSITYRIYADLLPNFKLLSVYGDDKRNQKARFKTSTSFYNHPSGDKNALNAKADIENSVLALDSYLTLGGAAKKFHGILKKDDNAVASWFTTGLLNADPKMGIPLTQKDGYIAAITGFPIQDPQSAGIKADVFGDATVVGDSLVYGLTESGGYFSSGVVRGADTVDNKVLIAQVTTNGHFQFELNILVQDMGLNGRAQYFVAQNPQPSSFPLTADDDVKLSDLTYDSYIVTDIHTTTKTTDNLTVSFYPNPTDNLLNMEITATEPNSKGSYIIYGLMGNAIAQKELTGINGTYKEGIDISSLAKGLYTIQVNINGATTAKKIIKN